MTGRVTVVVYVVHDYPTHTQTFVASEWAQVAAVSPHTLLFPLHSEGSHVDGALVRFSMVRSLAVIALSLLRHPAQFISLLGAPPRSARALSRQAFAVYRAAQLKLALDTRFGDATDAHLHAHFLGRTLEVAMYASLMRSSRTTLVSATAHAADARGSESKVRLSRMVGQTEFVACASESVRRELHRTTGFSVTPIVHCGVARGDLCDNSASKATSSPAILSVGRMVEKKGFDDCIVVGRRLKCEGVKFTWTFVGDGPLRAEYESQSRDLVEAGYFRWMGHRSHSEVLRMMTEEANLFVLPSKKAMNGDVDGIPVVLMEAMTRGLPVIATHLSGIPELVRRGITGYLAEPNDAESLYGTIVSAIDDIRSGEAEAIRWAGKELVDAEFNAEREAEKLMSLIHRASALGESGLGSAR